MPQMMPLSWMLLFMMFSMTLILFATMNYYTNIQKAKTTKKEKIPTKTMSWKW
uniref:ATP synthase complex subunit 8 n=2 Tax=Kalotermitidae TaxID=46562 RepID=A0A8X8M2S0_9NEOP|nr:ATP synthase F0 subunit 8 [Glyptotermes sp. 13 AB-2022a]URX53853.1 ATP synthase F0 subunit 8 [Postelectrotermes sp. 2 AB-2022a]URX53866.1 ATP synthase F0 subunit 8 [Postelectrotermes sp. 2 AB-2022a]